MMVGIPNNDCRRRSIPGSQQIPPQWATSCRLSNKLYRKDDHSRRRKAAVWAEDRFTARIARGRVPTAELLDSGRIVRRQPAASHRVDEVVVDFGVKRKVLVK